MKGKLSDYTPVEIARYTLMDIVLTAYNEQIGTNDELLVPNYSDEEKAEMGRYFALVLSERTK